MNPLRALSKAARVAQQYQQPVQRIAGAVAKVLPGTQAATVANAASVAVRVLARVEVRNVEPGPIPRAPSGPRAVPQQQGAASYVMPADQAPLSEDASAVLDADGEVIMYL
jgi:hypothetical protein